MNQKYFIGANAKKSSEGVSLPPISKIILIVDEENAFEAGNDTGYALEVYCPYGTQQMAYDLLAQARGFVYTGYSAKSAQLSPEAELGDGITVGSTYGMLAFRKFSFTPKFTEDIEAPLEKEVDHEYSYEGTLTKEVKRKLTLGASYYGTSITRAHGLEIKHYDASGNPTTRVTLNSETLAFYNADGNKAFYYDSTSGEFKISSSIVVGLDEYEKKAELSTDISTYIDTAEGTAKIVSACSATYLSKTSAAAQYETITAAAQIAQSVSDVQSEISLSASYGSGTIGSNVRALLQLVSNADTSSIEIKADKINFSGVTTFLRPGDNISKLTNNAGYQTSENVTTIIGDTVTTGYIEALNISVGAAQITGKLTASQINANNITATGVTLTGSITAIEGTIGGCSIVNGELQVPVANVIGDLSANRITTGTMSADRISGGTIDATNVTIKNLDVSNAHIQTLYAYNSNYYVVLRSSGTNTLYIGGDSSWGAVKYIYMYAQNSVDIGKAGSSLIINTQDRNVCPESASLSWDLGTIVRPFNTGYFTTLYVGGKEVAFNTISAVGSNSNITLNASRQLVPSGTGVSSGISLGNSTYPFYDIYTNIAHIGTSSYDSSLGFFGTTPHKKIAVNKASTTDTLGTVIAKLNEVISALHDYGLI